MVSSLRWVFGLVLAAVAVCAVTVYAAEDKPEAPSAQSIAAAYFKALMEGEEESANALVAAPFSFDRKEILQTKEEVEKKHQQMIANKGKRKVPEHTIGVSKKAPELDRKVFPEYEVFRIELTGGKDDHIDIYVSKGRVIGFSD